MNWKQVLDEQSNPPPIPKVTFKMAQLCTWEEKPCVGGPGESVASSRSEDFCEPGLGIRGHGAGPAKHSLIYYASGQITVRTAAVPGERGARGRLGLPAALS